LACDLLTIHSVNKKRTYTMLELYLGVFMK